MAAVAPRETDQAAAAAAAASDNDNNGRPPAKLLHPQLLMAARRGDSERLKDDDDDDELQVPKAAAKQDEGAVVVEVDRHRPSSAAAAAPDDSPPLLLLGLDGVTAGEGDSLLHVVATSGDSQEFLDCATMIHEHVGKGLLGARNNKGDTPLHCAAGAGNTHMISRLVALVTGDKEAAKAFLRLENDLGETALHHAVRAANKPAIALTSYSLWIQSWCAEASFHHVREGRSCRLLVLLPLHGPPSIWPFRWVKYLLHAICWTQAVVFFFFLETEDFIAFYI
jgi:hypothetical protein